jgi:hypothetical protein
VAQSYESAGTSVPGAAVAYTGYVPISEAPNAQYLPTQMYMPLQTSYPAQVWLLVASFPICLSQHIVPSAREDRPRFIIICHLIEDVVVPVRFIAVVLLVCIASTSA